MADTSPANDPGADGTLRFDYIKSNLFRVIRADGVIGSVTPSGHIHMALFSERTAIPQTTIHKVVDGGPGEMISREGREGYVRELDIDVFLTVDMATKLSSWLQDRIEELRARTKEDDPR